MRRFFAGAHVNSSPSAADIKTLSDKVAISELLHRRARAADRRDSELAAACYHPEATEDHSGFFGLAAEFISLTPTGDPDHPIKKMWHGLTSTLSEVSGDSATAETYFYAVLVLDVAGALKDVSMAGRYIDELVGYEGEWVIMHRVAVFDWTNVQDVGEQYWEARGIDVSSFRLGAPSPTDELYRLNRPGHQRWPGETLSTRGSGNGFA